MIGRNLSTGAYRMYSELTRSGAILLIRCMTDDQLYISWVVREDEDEG